MQQQQQTEKRTNIFRVRQIPITKKVRIPDCLHQSMGRIRRDLNLKTQIEIYLKTDPLSIKSFFIELKQDSKPKMK